MQNTIDQLRSVEAELAAEEERLNAQLAELKQKRDGLLAVIDMFNADGSIEAPTVTPTAKATKAKTTKAKTTKAKATKAKVTKAKATKAKTTKTKAAATAKPKATTKNKTTAKKKDGRTANWQKYTRPGVKNQSMPDAVKLILTTQPDKEFKIAEVMKALFKEDMPKAQYLKARNRISNVLSGGVRAGDWYRGARSSYSMKQAG